MKNFIYLIAITVFISTVFISCKEKVEVSSIQLDKTTQLIAVGGTTTLTADIRPYNATNRRTSSNSSVATVSLNTEIKGLVTAKSEGIATITATTKDGKFTATCIVTVINAEPKMVQVEGGTFAMGCTDNDCSEDGRELPIHNVTLHSFKIAKYPVTQEQWKAVMENNPSNSKGDDFPVETVTWIDIQEFIKKLNIYSGKNYRLPTEAEWEYAARGGNKNKGYKYSGSDIIDDVAWYNGNSNYQIHPIGTKSPNELGIYDMSGNVWEWCSDWYGDYTEDSQINPTGPISGSYYVIRGGSYYNTAKGARVASRTWGFSGYHSFDLGFRLVLP